MPTVDDGSWTLWIKEVDRMLVQLERQYEIAKQAYGIKPDMVAVKDRIDEAGTTLFALGDLLAEMQEMGFEHDPTVLQRVQAKYDALHEMAVEHKKYENIVIVRSRFGHTEKHSCN